MLNAWISRVRRGLRRVGRNRRGGWWQFLPPPPPPPPLPFPLPPPLPLPLPLPLPAFLPEALAATLLPTDLSERSLSADFAPFDSPITCPTVTPIDFAIWPQPRPLARWSMTPLSAPRNALDVAFGPTCDFASDMAISMLPNPMVLPVPDTVVPATVTSLPARMPSTTARASSFDPMAGA